MKNLSWKKTLSLTASELKCLHISKQIYGLQNIFSILAFFTKSNDYISTLGKVISQLEYYGLTKSE